MPRSFSFLPSFSSRLAISLGAACALAVQVSAQGPACLSPKTPPRGQRVWGGEIREVFARVDAASSRKLVWTAEEGGRINRSINGGSTWSYANTPSTVRGALLDVHFYDSTHGWAVGVDGAVIKSSDAGVNWTQVTLQAGSGCTLPSVTSTAILWAVHFIDSQRGWIAGDEVFLYTTDGGATWCPVYIESVEQTTCEYELYAIDFVVDGTDPDVFRGLCSFEKRSGSSAVVLSTTDGVNWDEVTSYTPNPPTDFEAWDVEFDPAATSVSDATAYLVGGVGGSPGRMYVSDDSGDSWTREFPVLPEPVPTCTEGMFACGAQMFSGVNTLYGVAALSDTEAIAVGYGGTRFRRIFDTLISAYVWLSETDRCDFTMPLNGAAAIDASTAWLVGSSGYLRRTDDGGDTYTDQRPANGSGVRIKDLAFSSDLEGWIVGSNTVIVHTDDGGCSWDVENNESCVSGKAVLFGVSAMENSLGTFAVAVGAGGVLIARDTTGSTTTWPNRLVYDPTPSNTSDPLPKFFDVDAAEGSTSMTFWAVGEGGAVLSTDDGGENWSAVSNVPSGVVFYGVAMVSPDEGFLVGQDSSGNGVFYTVDSATSSPNFVSRTISSTTLSIFKAVEANGSSLSGASAVAVGHGGFIVSWSGSAIAQVSGVSGTATTGILESVELVPGTSDVLAGGSKGLLISFPYAGSSYTTPKSHTSKTIYGFASRSASLGYFVSEGLDESGASTAQGDATVLAIY